jgi:predicted O-methyltransferase YrrM
LGATSARIVIEKEVALQVSENDRNWKFAGDLVVEPEVIGKARRQSLELGVEPIPEAVGAQLAVAVASMGAQTVLEIGTGVGVSGLWLLRGGSAGVLTSIDSEPHNQQQARAFFTEAAVPAARARLITGDAHEVLPRMNEGAYDVVFVDADPESVIEYVEHALRLVRAGGLVLVAHALWKGRVSDPAQRDDVASAFRSLATEIAASTAVLSALSPVGDGLLQISKLGD